MDPRTTRLSGQNARVLVKVRDLHALLQIFTDSVAVHA